MYRRVQAQVLILKKYLNLKKTLFGLFLIIYTIGYKFQIESLFNIYIAELISLALFFYIIINLNISIGLRNILFSYLIIFFGLCISDFLNDSIIYNYLRGWAGIIMSAINLIFMYYIFKLDIRFIFLYLFCLILRLIFVDLSFLDWEQLTQNKNLFKVHFMESYGAFILIVLYGIEKWFYKYLNIVLIGVFLFTLFLLNSRGFALLIIMAYIIINFVFGNKAILARILILSSVMYLFYCLYIIAILHFNIAGSTLSALDHIDNYFNPVEFLIVSRSDFFVALYAIIEKPIMGWGSWAFDPSGDFERLFVEIHGASEYDGSFIPAHSVILTAWLWGGILALLGAICLFINLIKISKPIQFYDGGYRVIATILILGLIFDFFFSPIGVLRVSFPSTIALILVLNNKISNHQIEK